AGGRVCLLRQRAGPLGAAPCWIQTRRRVCRAGTSCSQVGADRSSRALSKANPSVPSVSARATRSAVLLLEALLLEALLLEALLLEAPLLEAPLLEALLLEALLIPLLPFWAGLLK